MIADLKPYPAYKDSGVPWLGQMPEHWEVLPFKYNYRVSMGQTILATDLKDDGEFPVISATEEDHYFGRISSPRFVLRPSDFVIPARGVSIGAVKRVTEPSVCTQTTIYAKQHSDQALESDFIFFYLRGCRTWLFEYDRTAIPQLTVEQVRNNPTLIPPLPEQTAIARFLDHYDRKIRRYILAKQKLIKLLEEQKQAIIHHAVTRGLDPNARLKPSGVEWLGDMPEHWEVKRTKVLFRLRTEKSGTAHGQELLSIYTHVGVRPRKDLEERGNKASTTDDYWIVRRGDIIANKLLAWMGAIGVSHYDGVTSPAYDILMPIVDLIPDYYHHLFRTRLYLQQFKQRSRGIMDMRLRLYFDQFGQILVPVPPLDEQRAIVRFYNDATVDTDRVIDRTRREISLLREYRTRLIADVVTGKLDVRSVELPELDEAEILDGLETSEDIEEVVSEEGDEEALEGLDA